MKNLFKDTLQELLEAELDENLRYEKYEYSDEPKNNYRNGSLKKTVHSTAGDIELSVPRDRNGEFEIVIVEKGEKDISGIEEKLIRMYARGTSNKRMANNTFRLMYILLCLFDTTYFYVKDGGVIISEFSVFF